MSVRPLVAAQGFCPWCEGHMGWGGWAMMAGWLVILILVLALVWAFARSRGCRDGGPEGRDPAEDALRESYARGEIDERTYRGRLDELRRR